MSRIRVPDHAPARSHLVVVDVAGLGSSSAPAASAFSLLLLVAESAPKNLVVLVSVSCGTALSSGFCIAAMNGAAREERHGRSWKGAVFEAKGGGNASEMRCLFKANGNASERQRLTSTTSPSGGCRSAAAALCKLLPNLMVVARVRPHGKAGFLALKQRCLCWRSLRHVTARSHHTNWP